MKELRFKQYNEDIKILAGKIKDSKKQYQAIYPIPRGGYYPAIALSNLLHIPIVQTLDPNLSILIVDDIVESGKTLEAYPGYDKAVVYADVRTKDKVQFYGKTKSCWLMLPDEKGCGIDDHIRRVLEFIGEDPNRPGLQGTPDRIIRMWKEIFRGYDPVQKPKITTFDNGMDGISYSDIITDRGSFYSMCEHHMMPFFGTYFFAYIPNPEGKILGLSKVARVVDYCAARLQVQERLAYDIVKMLHDALCEGTDQEPLAMAVILRGEHLCKSMRGVKKPGHMESMYLGGLFNNPTQRKELLDLYNHTV